MSKLDLYRDAKARLAEARSCVESLGFSRVRLRLRSEGFVFGGFVFEDGEAVVAIPWELGEWLKTVVGAESERLIGLALELMESRVASFRDEARAEALGFLAEGDGDEIDPDDDGDAEKRRTEL